NREWHIGPPAEPGKHLAKPGWGDRSATLGDKYVRSWRAPPLQSAQCPQLAVAEVVGCRVATFGAVDTDGLAGQVDLVPFQRTQFRGSQAVPERHQDRGGIAVAISAILAGG